MQSTVTRHRLQRRQQKTSPGDLTVISLQDMKDYLLETEDEDQDDVIESLIESAVAEMEQALTYAIDTESEIYQYYDFWPSDGRLCIWHKAIDPASVVVQYRDATDYEWVTFAATNYIVDAVQVPNYIQLKSAASWPSDKADDPASIRITFTIDAARTLKKDIIGAIKRMVADQYEGRENSSSSSIMVSAVDRVVQRNRMHL